MIISINVWGMRFAADNQSKSNYTNNIEITADSGSLLRDLTELFSRYEIDAKDLKDRICKSEISLDTKEGNQYFFDLYIQRLEGLIGYKISPKQIELLKEFHINNSDSNPSLNRRKELKKEYNQKRSALIKEWEHEYTKKWPTYDAGDEKRGILKIVPMTAHHIIPREVGGVNKWWNIAPLSLGQHMVIHQCSVEEKACFSPDFAEREFFRIFLEIKSVYPTTEKYKLGQMILEKNISNSSRQILLKKSENKYMKITDQDVTKSEGSIINYQNKEVTASFIRAIVDNDKETVKKILKQGIDINSKDQNGDTFLVLAVKNKRKTVVKKLLKYGADFLIKSHDGKTPLQIATEKRYKRITEILQGYEVRTISLNETENKSTEEM